MIIYLLLQAILYIIGVISSIFGGLIPDFPEAISTVLATISTMIDGGISFVSYFFYIPVISALISIVLMWHTFTLVKDMVMKAIGHFLGN